MDKAVATDTVLWFLLAKHLWKITPRITLLLQLKWYTFFPYMFHHSLYFRSDDSSLHYCFCICIALIGSFRVITSIWNWQILFLTTYRFVSSLPAFFLSFLPPFFPSTLLSLIPPPHLPQSQVVLFFIFTAVQLYREWAGGFCSLYC